MTPRGTSTILQVIDIDLGDELQNGIEGASRLHRSCFHSRAVADPRASCAIKDRQRPTRFGSSRVPGLRAAPRLRGRAGCHYMSSSRWLRDACPSSRLERRASKRSSECSPPVLGDRPREAGAEPAERTAIDSWCGDQNVHELEARGKHFVMHLLRLLAEGCGRSPPCATLPRVSRVTRRTDSAEDIAGIRHATAASPLVWRGSSTAAC